MYPAKHLIKTTTYPIMTRFMEELNVQDKSILRATKVIAGRVGYSPSILPTGNIHKTLHAVEMQCRVFMGEESMKHKMNQMVTEKKYPALYKLMGTLLIGNYTVFTGQLEVAKYVNYPKEILSTDKLHESLSNLELWCKKYFLLPEQEKHFTLQDIKDAYEAGFYDGAGDDLWYKDHTTEGLLPSAAVFKPLKEYLTSLEETNNEPSISKDN